MATRATPKKKTAKKAEKKEAERRARPRPKVQQSYGVTRCLFCHRPFDRTRPWSKFDTDYCKMMHWLILHRRKTKSGVVVAIDGHSVDPVPALDVELIAQTAREEQKRQEEFEAMKKAIGKE